MREKLLYKVNEMMYNRAALGWKVPNPANYRYFTIYFEDKYLQYFKMRFDKIKFVDDRGYAFHSIIINNHIIIRLKDDSKLKPETIGWLLDLGFTEI